MCFGYIEKSLKFAGKSGIARLFLSLNNHRDNNKISANWKMIRHSLDKRLRL